MSGRGFVRAWAASACFARVIRRSCTGPSANEASASLGRQPLRRRLANASATQRWKACANADGGTLACRTMKTS